MNYNLTDINLIKDLCSRYDFRFSKSLGQNFLTSASILEKICCVCDADKDTAVLEIGPGIGTLTSALAERAGKVAAIEIDKSLIPVLSETLDGHDNIKIINADALKTDLNKLCTEEFTQMKYIVCANLPYYITAEAVEKVLTSRLFSSVTLMLQYEAARRICSNPGDEQYCALSAISDFYAERSIAFSVPADCFYPRPGVGSAVLHLSVRKTLPYPDDKFVLRIINAAFAQRRKTLANALSNNGICSRSFAETALDKCGFAPNVRAEKLTGADFARLAAVFSSLNEESEK